MGKTLLYQKIFKKVDLKHSQYIVPPLESKITVSGHLNPFAISWVVTYIYNSLILRYYLTFPTLQQ